MMLSEIKKIAALRAEATQGEWGVNTKDEDADGHDIIAGAVFDEDADEWRPVDFASHRCIEYRHGVFCDADDEASAPKLAAQAREAAMNAHFISAAANLDWQRLTDYIAALEDVAVAGRLALDTLMSGLGAGGLPGLQASAIRLQAAEILDNSLAKLDALETP
jgi:hypothetical protein